MTPRSKPPEEILSACHDGEATPAERAEVERLLADSPAHQETLDDFRELTAVLQSLPRPAAPAHLQLDVLRRVRAASTARLKEQSSRRRPWLWGVSLAATAALVLLLVRGPAPQIGRTDVATSVPAPRAAVPDRPALSDAVAAANDLRESAEPPMVHETAEDFAASRQAGGALPAAPALPRSAPPIDTPSPHPVAAAPVPALSSLSGEALSRRLNLDATAPPRDSEILTYVQEVGDQVVLVEFDVVNVDQTAADLLVLLRRRGVSIVDSAEERAADATLNAKSLPSAAPGELVALYVEATESQLAAALDEFMAQTAVTEGALHNTDIAGPLLTSRLQRIAARSAAMPAESLAPSRDALSAGASPRETADATVPSAGTPAVPAAEAEAAGRPEQKPSTFAAAAVDPPTPQGVRLAITREAIRDIQQRAAPVNEAATASAAVEITTQARREAPVIPSTMADGVPTSGSADFRRVLFILQPTPEH